MSQDTNKKPLTAACAFTAKFQTINVCTDLGSQSSFFTRHKTDIIKAAVATSCIAALVFPPVLLGTLGILILASTLSIMLALASKWFANKHYPKTGNDFDEGRYSPIPGMPGHRQ